MPQISSGLYQILLEQNYRGQQVLNSFFYEHTLGQDDEQNLAALAFDETIMDEIVKIQNLTNNYVVIRAKNVTGSLADAVLVPSQADGDVIGEAVNTFTAAGYRLNRTTKETRNGQKRFSGMVEENMETQAWSAAFKIILDAFALILAGQITTVGAVFDPVIARELVTPVGDWLANPVSSVTANNFITTQNSRKVAF